MIAATGVSSPVAAAITNPQTRPAEPHPWGVVATQVRPDQQRGGMQRDGALQPDARHDASDEQDARLDRPPAVFACHYEEHRDDRREDCRHDVALAASDRDISRDELGLVGSLTDEGYDGAHEAGVHQGSQDAREGEREAVLREGADGHRSQRDESREHRQYVGEDLTGGEVSQQDQAAARDRRGRAHLPGP